MRKLRLRESRLPLELHGWEMAAEDSVLVARSQPFCPSREARFECRAYPVQLSESRPLSLCCAWDTFWLPCGAAPTLSLPGRPCSCPRWTCQLQCLCLCVCVCVCVCVCIHVHTSPLDRTLAEAGTVSFDLCISDTSVVDGYQTDSSSKHASVLPHCALGQERVKMGPGQILERGFAPSLPGRGGGSCMCRLPGERYNQNCEVWSHREPENLFSSC